MIRVLALCALAGAFMLAACSQEPKRDSPPATSSGAPATTRLDGERVPADLRHLTGLAEEWGIGDDVERGQKVERSTPAEREALRAALAPHQTRITAWLDSFGQGTVMPDEAAAFMYMQLAVEEMPR